VTLTVVWPTTTADAVGELVDDETHLLAGGTSIVLLMNTGLLDPARLVGLSRIPGLDQVCDMGTEIEIGSMCTHEQLSRSIDLYTRLPALCRLFAGIGNVRVRSWATLGGNLAHADPAQDPAVLLSALHATAVAEGPDGIRTIPVRELASGPFATVLQNELLTAIRVPVPEPNVSCSYVKFLPRTADDYATVSVGARVEADGDGVVTAADLALGAVGPTVVVADKAAAMLVGHHADDPAALKAMADALREGIDPPSDHRGSSDYRREMAGVMAIRAVRQSVCREEQ
jgi:carbon-monoxide dehydrogenase medium subunit